MFLHQFWKVRTVLKSPEPEFSKTHLGREKRPIIDVVIASFPKCHFFLRHPVDVTQLSFIFNSYPFFCPFFPINNFSPKFQLLVKVMVTPPELWSTQKYVRLVRPFHKNLSLAHLRRCCWPRWVIPIRLMLRFRAYFQVQTTF